MVICSVQLTRFKAGSQVDQNRKGRAAEVVGRLATRTQARWLAIRKIPCIPHDHDETPLVAPRGRAKDDGVWAEEEKRAG